MKSQIYPGIETMLYEFRYIQDVLIGWFLSINTSIFMILVI
jgi:hypothetical protein